LAVAVRVVDQKTGETLTGKLAIIQEGKVTLYSGSMPDKKGGLRGCGKKCVLPLESVAVSADNPDREIKRSS